jgi:glycerate kinase
MKVVIAPDSFKDALRAEQAAKSISLGIINSAANVVEYDICPISDGGEGFADVIAFNHQSAQQRVCQAVDPLSRIIFAEWSMLMCKAGCPETAVIELAAASGLELLKPQERNPLKTTTVGTGALLLDAVKEKPKQILLGLGGSATCDAGIGLVSAFGVIFHEHEGRHLIWPKMNGQAMQKVTRILPSDPSVVMSGIPIRVACDVTNPLTGPNGAAHVYAPQKGATPEQVEELDAGLRHMAQLWRDQLGIDVEDMPGAGAAGGVGGGLVAMLGAELVPGAELVLDTINFDERIKDADLVITGEGRLDRQSLQGKAAMTVAKRCQRAGVPCVALVGSVGEGADEALNYGLSAYHVIGDGLPAEESIRRTGELLEAAAVKLAQDRLMS